MKILFLCHKMPYPPVDGGAIASLNMITGFADAGHEVTVLAMKTPKHNTSINNIPKSHKRNISWQGVFVDTTINPVHTIVNILFSKKPYNAVRFINKQYALKLQELLKSDFDIIQLEGLYLTPYIKAIKVLSSAKIALRSHNVEWKIWQRLADTETTLYKKHYYTLLAKRIRRMEYKALEQIDLLVPITKQDQKELPFSNPANIFVSQTGILKENIGLVDPTFKKTLFHIGALDWIPNQEGLKWFIQNVWQSIHQQYPDWTFKIAGRNAPKDFEKEIKTQNIEYIGEVENAKSFMDENNLMIVPLLAGSGMRIKIIEGMARGKCIITTSIGAEGIEVSSNKNIIIANNSEKMRQSLIELMHSPEKVKEISNNAIEFIKSDFENSKMINDLALFYKNKLNG